jgi:FtsH-binding integral membrane protein
MTKTNVGNKGDYAKRNFIRKVYSIFGAVSFIILSLMYFMDKYVNYPYSNQWGGYYVLFGWIIAIIFLFSFVYQLARKTNKRVQIFSLVGFAIIMLAFVEDMLFFPNFEIRLIANAVIYAIGVLFAFYIYFKD